GTTISGPCLHNEINSSAIVSVLEGIIIEADVVKIAFQSTLSAPDKVILDDIIANHDNACPLEQEDFVSSLEILEEGEVISEGANSVDFIGNVDVSDGEGDITVDILGASSGGEGNNTTISFGDHTGAFLLSDKSVYEVRANIIYRGSNNIGIINKIKAIAWVKQSEKPGDILIYDVTNGNIIVEKNGINGEVSEIIDLGTLSNIPTEEAVFEIQLRNIPGEMYFASLMLEF
ncbi:MAG: hypothetical protein ACTSYR_03375, partial [Candidatus Odinarchaeia archaeon]